MTGLDTGDHLRLGLVYKFVGEPLEAIGERAGLLVLNALSLGNFAERINSMTCVTTG